MSRDITTLTGAAQVDIVHHGGGIAAANELLELLKVEAWCSARLISGDAPALSRSSPRPVSLTILASNNSSFAIGMAQTLREQSPATRLIFVNLFPHPSPCLELLTNGFEDFLSYPFTLSTRPR